MTYDGTKSLGDEAKRICNEIIDRRFRERRLDDCIQATAHEVAQAVAEFAAVSFTSRLSDGGGQGYIWELLDKIEGLDADLYCAVEVAYKRGATEWTRLNYPEWYARFEAARLATLPNGVGEP